MQTLIVPIQIILNAKDRELSLCISALPLPILKNFIELLFISILWFCKV